VYQHSGEKFQGFENTNSEIVNTPMSVMLHANAIDCKALRNKPWTGLIPK
jgi:hypothetical protein